MSEKIKFVHTNIIAKDWRRLAQFYIDVFDCEPMYPERDLSGEWIEKITNIPNIAIKGIHLKLPGYTNGPTLEIFEYNKLSTLDKIPLINDPGFSHIAFHVNDIEEILQKLISNGGEPYGELIEKEYDEIGILKVMYTKDIEGNIIEIQNWRKKQHPEFD